MSTTNNLIKQVLSLVITTLIALVLRSYMPRQLGVQNMGVFYHAEALAMSFFSILSLGLGTFIIKEISINKDYTKEIFSPILIIQLFLGIIIELILILYIFLINKNNILIMTISIIIGIYIAFFNFQRNILQRFFIAWDMLGFVSLVDIITKLVLVITASLSLFIYPDLIFVSICFALSEIVGVFILFNIAIKKNLIHNLNIFNSLNNFIKSIFMYIKYLLKNNQNDLNLAQKYSPLIKIIYLSLPFFITNILTTIYSSIDILILSKLLNEQEVGLYGAALKLQGLFLILIPIISNVYTPVLSRTQSENKGQNLILLTNIIRNLITASFILSSGLLFFADIAVSILYGQNFLKATGTVAILTSGIVLSYLSVILCVFINISTKGSVLIYTTIMSIIINVLLNYNFIPYGVKYWGIGGGGIASALATSLSELFVIIMLFVLLPSKAITFSTIKNICLSILPLIVIGLNFNKLYAIPLYIRILFFIFILPIYLLITQLLKLKDINVFMINLKQNDKYNKIINKIKGLIK